MGVEPDEDPFSIFEGPAEEVCIGDWKNDALAVKVSQRGSRLLLESRGKELVLTNIGKDQWNVLQEEEEDTDPVYIATVSGLGRNVRLSLKAPAHKANGKEAFLRRSEHLEDNTKSAAGGGARRERKKSRGSSAGSGDDRDDDRSRSRGRGGKRRRGGRRRGGRRARRDESASRSGSRSPARIADKGGGKGDDDEITTLFVSGLPGDAREDEIRQDLEDMGDVQRVVMMKRGAGECNAFVRFSSAREMKRALDKILDGRVEVCEQKVKAEIARRNTN